jgi:hypothetical protein
VLSYAYHCCQFQALTVFGGHPNSALGSSLQEDVIYPTDRDFDSALSSLNLSELWPWLGKYIYIHAHTPRPKSSLGSLGSFRVFRIICD